MNKMNNAQKIRDIATKYRIKLEEKYGKDQYSLMGKCIEATDTLVVMYKRIGIKASAKQVWVLYENFEGCTDICYEEHWLVKIELNKSQNLYVDITMSQFQWAFSRKLPAVYIDDTLPNFYLSRKPGKVTLDKCGWNDWYNYGDYTNNFNYWNKYTKL